MSLGAPWMLVLLILSAPIAWLMVRGRRLQYEAACRLKGVVPADRGTAWTHRDSMKLAALICVVIALARPQWNPKQYEVDRRGRDLVLVVDVSRSMLAADVFPNRLEMARIAIHEAFPVLTGQRVGLVTFAGSASVRVPLTLDHEFVRYMLDRADPAQVDLGSTSLQAAVEKVETVLTDASGGRRDLVLFTDGEDHLSDIEKTATQLAQHSARVLIVGLGDPVQGASLPDPLDEDKWMKHNGAEVVSRLHEDTLEELAARAPNVTYYPARDRPFDFVTVYRQWVDRAGDDSVVGGMSQTRYTEGYPYLLALAALLWLVAGSVRLPGVRLLLLLALLLPGCSRSVEDSQQAEFQMRFEQGSELLGYAQETLELDPFAARSLLVDAREEFLCAALLKQGDVETARQITGITRQLRELQSAIEQQQAEEKRQGELLEDMILRLEKLYVRQERLCQRSQRIMRSRPVESESEYNVPESSALQLPPQAELNRLAPSFAREQQALREGTASVMDGLVEKQQALRQILKRAYGMKNSLPATEVDPIVELLGIALSAQDEALSNFAPESVRWPQANSGLHTASGRMEQALDALRGLQPPTTEDDQDAMASRTVGGGDQEMEDVDAEQRNSNAQPVSPGDFQEALSLKVLPIPNYTPAEILAEEAANQRKRARRKAARSASQVEKNW